MAHIRQSSPDSGCGVQVKVLEIFSVVLSPLGTFISMICRSLQEEKRKVGARERERVCVCV